MLSTFSGIRADSSSENSFVLQAADGSMLRLKPRLGYSRQFDVLLSDDKVGTCDVDDMRSLKVVSKPSASFVIVTDDAIMLIGFEDTAPYAYKVTKLPRLKADVLLKINYVASVRKSMPLTVVFKHDSAGTQSRGSFDVSDALTCECDFLTRRRKEKGDREETILLNVIVRSKRYTNLFRKVHIKFFKKVDIGFEKIDCMPSDVGPWLLVKGTLNAVVEAFDFQSACTELMTQIQLGSKVITQAFTNKEEHTFHIGDEWVMYRHLHQVRSMDSGKIKLSKLYSHKPGHTYHDGSVPHVYPLDPANKLYFDMEQLEADKLRKKRRHMRKNGTWEGNNDDSQSLDTEDADY